MRGAPTRAGLLSGVAQILVRRMFEERGRGSPVVELQVDHDVGGIVDRPADDVATDAGGRTQAGESVERLFPGGEIGDGVLDVQCGHGSRLPASPAGAYPR